jgi:hypothetical protein
MEATKEPTMSTRDKLIFLKEADRTLASNDVRDVPEDYFRQHGDRWRSALSRDRLTAMRELRETDELPEPWLSELEAVLAAVGVQS